MSIAVSDYADGKHVITVEKLFPEMYSHKKDTEEELKDTASDQHILSKANDSLIHIPFYIYR